MLESFILQDADDGGQVESQEFLSSNICQQPIAVLVYVQTLYTYVYDLEKVVNPNR